MKKIKILLLTAALLGSTSVFAQQDWTASVGYATTAFRGTDCSQFLSTHGMHGFYAGVRHDFYFSALAGLTFEPGLLFYYQSGRNDSGLSPKYIKMHYLSLPMDVKYTFGISGGTTAAVYTGPVLNVGLIGNLFEKDYVEERRQEYIDNLNILYVAFTRPIDVLHVIAQAPKEGESASFPAILRTYAEAIGGNRHGAS